MDTQNISKKKKAQFDLILTLHDKKNFVINIKLLRNIFDSDFYEHFLIYSEQKIKNVLECEEFFVIHVDISNFHVSDLSYYSQLLKFAYMLHKYTHNLANIFIYNSSSIFTNLVSALSLSLGCDVSKKILLESNPKYKL